MSRVAALWMWCFAVWLVLTWTITLEQELIGAALSLAIALAFAPLGGVVRPWALADPRRLAAALVLLGLSLGRVLLANLKLAYRIWSPRRPIASGMVIVPTEAHSEGGLTAVGLLTSLIVDNQIVDLDRGRAELQYHAIEVPQGSAKEKREAINGPLERQLEILLGGRL